MNPILLICSCAVGERMLSNCSETTNQSALCWPCEAGYYCADGLQMPCAFGTWSARGAGQCSACSVQCPRNGQMTVLPCEATSDRVCVDCPAGYGCDNTSHAVLCPANTYSVQGGCRACAVNFSSEAGSTDCVLSACGPGEFAVNGACRLCPDGFECSNGVAVQCPANTYSHLGACMACDPNARSESGSAASEQCVCISGYVKTGTQCSACKAGTVWKDQQCMLCDAGHYCVGKTHMDRCPLDMYSHRGSAVCTDCRPFSGCTGVCVDALNCSCDDGYVDHHGCQRCPPATMKAQNQCKPCSPGYECLGGPDVRQCELGTFSPGNSSHCAQCSVCKQITATRCNATHDSVCAQTTVPLVFVKIYQEYKTSIDGETFSMFAMIYASTLPRASLIRVCGEGGCVECFQGICPIYRMKTLLFGPKYQMVIEVRFDASRMHQNVEALTQSAFLSETAKTTMQRLTDVPFVSYSRVEHEVICPDGLVWDARLSVCYKQRPDSEGGNQRTWLGLILGIVLLCAIGVYGGKKGMQRAGWTRMDAVESEK